MPLEPDVVAGAGSARWWAVNAQKRLGAAIVSRRVGLGMKTREQLAAKIYLSYRSLSDLENGRRSFSANTHALVEHALEWEPGTVARILAGGSSALQARLANAGHAQVKPSRRVINRHPRLASNSSRHVSEMQGRHPAGYIAAHIIPGEEPSEIPFIIWNNLVASSASQAERFRADAERGESEGPWRIYALIDVTYEMPVDELQGGAS